VLGIGVDEEEEGIGVDVLGIGVDEEEEGIGVDVLGIGVDEEEEGIGVDVLGIGVDEEEEGIGVDEVIGVGVEAADVLDEVSVGMASSSTVAAGIPALASSRLMLSTVSLAEIASAAPWSAAMMPVSTRMASARRCRRLPMLSIL
jgi:hypothetical protein